LGWALALFNHIHHFPSLQEAFGNGRPALSAIGLLVPALRQAATNKTGSWLVPWVIIAFGGFVAEYAAIAARAADDDETQHLYAVITLASLGFAAVLGALGIAVTTSKTPE
jgi:hypothetical protein